LNSWRLDRALRPGPRVRTGPEGPARCKYSRRLLAAPPETRAPPPVGHAPSPSRVLSSQGDRPPQRCPPHRVAPRWLGCSLRARSSPGLTGRVRASRSSAIGPSPRTPRPSCEGRGSSLPSIRPKGTLSRGSIPCESPGCACRAALAVFVRRLSPALGSASPGVLRPYDACNSGCPASAVTGSTHHGRRGIPPPRPVPPSGFSQPLGGFGRDVIRLARVAPNPPFTPSLRPEV